MKKPLKSAILMILAGILNILGIFELFFPETFAFHELLANSFPDLWMYQTYIGCGELLVGNLLIWPAWRSEKVTAGKFLESYARIGIGLMFIFASLFKIQDPMQFAILVTQYQFLPEFAINFFSLFLPILEFIIGVAIIITPYTKENSLLLLGMFIAFIIALFQAVVRDLGITCGCFPMEGAHDKKEAWISLIRDVLLLAPVIFLMKRPNRSLISLWKNTKPE